MLTLVLVFRLGLPLVAGNRCGLDYRTNPSLLCPHLRYIRLTGGMLRAARTQVELLVLG